MSAKTCLAIISLAISLTGCWQKDVGRSYYPSGQLRTEATVRNGLLDDKTTSFYENGRKKAEGEYKDGVLHGVSTNWSTDGTEQSTSIFSSGVLQPAHI